MDKTYRIPDYRWPDLQHQIGILARRAAKLNCGKITFEVVGSDSVTDGKGAVSVFTLVKIAGESPRLPGGWQFAATLEHLTAGNVLRKVPGFDEIPDHYRTAPSGCDHCRKNIRRNDTFVVVNETGDWKQVGRNCLRDFTGHKNPEALAAFAEALIEMDALAMGAEDAYDDGGYSLGGPSHLSTVKFLEQVARIMREDGWVSKADSGPGNPSTADTATHFLLDRNVKWAEPSERDKIEVQAALAWLKAEIADAKRPNEYMWNLSLSCGEEYIGVRLTGIVASLIRTYQLSLARRVQFANSEWVGEVGKRVTLTGLTCKAIIELMGNYGATYLHKFQDSSGNILIWFSSRTELEISEIYVGKCSIKDHSTRDGVKQTIITRCKLEPAIQTLVQEA